MVYAGAHRSLQLEWDFPRQSQRRQRGRGAVPSDGPYGHGPMNLVQFIAVALAPHPGPGLNEDSIGGHGPHYAYIQAAHSVPESPGTAQRGRCLLNSGDQTVKMRSEGTVAIEVEPQILHIGPHFDAGSTYPYPRPWELSGPRPPCETDGLRLLRVYAQPKVVDTRDDGCHRDLRSADGPADTLLDGHLQRIVRITYQGCAVGKGGPQDRVVSEVPQMLRCGKR